MASLTYRPEIDGLRAIAVLSVIIFHISERALPGGYLGVDIFFVISGFLITSILIKDMRGAAQSGKTWNWARFYERRVRRIFPPLLTVLLASTIMAWLFFSGEELRAYSRSALSSLGFFANWHFLGETGYFDGPAQYKPLLHIWSLGVEEQYYLLFPLILWPLIKAAKRLAFPVILTLSLISFSVFIWQAFAAPQTAFYGAHARFWEIGSGSLLALFAREPRAITSMSFGLGKQIIPFIGLILIAQALCLLPGRLILEATNLAVRLPILPALFAVTGTAMIIAAGSGSLAARALSTRIMRGIGKISYALYLWHWPLLVFLAITVPGAGLIAKFGAITLALALATASYFLIEQPIRRGKVFKTARSLYISSLLCAGLIAAMAVYGLSAKPAIKVQSPAQIAYETERKRQVRQFYKEAGRAKCWIMTPDQLTQAKQTCLTLSHTKPNVLVIGDSHAASFFKPLKEAFPGVEFSTFAANSCGFIEAHIEPQHKACRALMAYIDNSAQVEKFDSVVLIRRISNPKHARDYAIFVENFAQKFNVPVTVIGPVPFYQPNLPTLYAAHMDKPPERLDRIFDAAIDPYVMAAEKKIGRALKGKAGIRYISPIDTLCPRGNRTCLHYTPAGRPILIDNSHMSPDGVRNLLRMWDERSALALP